MIVKNKIAIIGEVNTGKCKYCGKRKDLRPYGKNKALICFDCAMKPENKETTEQELGKLLDSLPKTPIN